jgi:DNA-binding CsgD family transcriptional regulator
MFELNGSALRATEGRGTLRAHLATRMWSDSVSPVEQSNSKFDLMDVLTSVLDEIDYPLIVVQANGHIRHANHLARYELSRGQVLSNSGGVLGTVSPQDAVTLGHALQRAAQGSRGLLELGVKGKKLTMALIPMSHAVECESSPVLIMCGRRRLCEPLSLGFFARQYGLTRTEEAVLTQLTNGSSPEGIAEDQGVAISTIRTQISSIRYKTQTHSMRELLSKVLSLPPFVSALRMV